MCVRITLNIKFYEILCFSSYICYKIFITYTGRQGHFPEIGISCSGPRKMCKTIKTGSRRFLRNQYFLLFIQKTVKMIVNFLLKNWFQRREKNERFQKRLHVIRWTSIFDMVKNMWPTEYCMNNIHSLSTRLHKRLIINILNY